MLIAGGQDRDSGAVSFRYRDGRQENGIPLADAIARILEIVNNKTQV
jgi:threonyl-tRNA synthetase